MNCNGRSADLRSAVLDSRSYKAWAMEVSSSDGLWRDGLLAAILFMALIFAMVVDGWKGVVVAMLKSPGVACICAKCALAKRAPLAWAVAEPEKYGSRPTSIKSITQTHHHVSS